MVPKSGHRFSEKIVLSQYAAGRAAIVELFRVSEALRQNNERAAQAALSTEPGSDGGGGGGPVRDSIQSGTGARPVPSGSFRRRGRRMPASRPFWSRTAKRQCDELRCLARFHAHQHGPLAAGAGVVERGTHLGRTRNRLAGDFEDHVAGLEAALGGGSVRIDRGDDDALAAASRNRAGGRQRQTEMALGTAGRIAAAAQAGLLITRVVAERHRYGLFRSLVQHGELGGGAGRQSPDLLGEIARILHRL